jgi:hypothetical protein
MSQFVYTYSDAQNGSSNLFLHANNIDQVYRYLVYKQKLFRFDDFFSSYIEQLSFVENNNKFNIFNFENNVNNRNKVIDKEIYDSVLYDKYLKKITDAESKVYFKKVTKFYKIYEKYHYHNRAEILKYLTNDELIAISNYMNTPGEGNQYGTPGKEWHKKTIIPMDEIKFIDVTNF